MKGDIAGLPMLPEGPFYDARSQTQFFDTGGEVREVAAKHAYRGCRLPIGCRSREVAQ